MKRSLKIIPRLIKTPLKQSAIVVKFPMYRRQIELEKKVEKFFRIKIYIHLF